MSLRVLNGFHLKLLVAIVMVIDHVGAVLFPGVMWLRCIGRGFPLFCFLIAEGCVHTRSFKKYALRLLVLAVPSELCFDLMHGAVWIPMRQTALWALLAGAVACWFIEGALKQHTAGSIVLTGVAMASLFYLLKVFRVDYGGWAMLLVAVFYAVRYLPCGEGIKMAAQTAGVALFCIGSVGGISIELWALAYLIPIWLYNGQRGFSHRAVQYGFYAFYPVHLLVLTLIAR